MTPWLPLYMLLRNMHHLFFFKNGSPACEFDQLEWSPIFLFFFVKIVEKKSVTTCFNFLHFAYWSCCLCFLSFRKKILLIRTSSRKKPNQLGIKWLGQLLSQRCPFDAIGWRMTSDSFFLCQAYSRPVSQLKPAFRERNLGQAWALRRRGYSTLQPLPWMSCPENVTRNELLTLVLVHKKRDAEWPTYPGSRAQKMWHGMTYLAWLSCSRNVTTRT